LQFTIYNNTLKSWVTTTNSLNGTIIPATQAAEQVVQIVFPEVYTSGLTKPVIFHMRVARGAPGNAYAGEWWLHSAGVHFTANKWGEN